MSILLGILIGVFTNEVIESNERQKTYSQARMTADSLGKPLLVVGVPKRLREAHPGGDVTIDSDLNVDAAMPYQVADVRNIPYSVKYFGAAFISHVLEHMDTPEDVKLAVDEMYRVADAVFVAGPHKNSIIA